MSNESCRRVNLLEKALEAKERELSEVKLMLEVSRGKGESNDTEACESHRSNSESDKLQSFFKRVVDEKDHTIQLLEEQLSFIKIAYRELQDEKNSICLEFIRDSIVNILKNVPLMDKETERMIHVLNNMLGVSVIQRNEIMNQRQFV